MSFMPTLTRTYDVRHRVAHRHISIRRSTMAARGPCPSSLRRPRPSRHAARPGRTYRTPAPNITANTNYLLAPMLSGTVIDNSNTTNYHHSCHVQAPCWQQHPLPPLTRSLMYHEKDAGAPIINTNYEPSTFDDIAAGGQE